MKKIVLLIHVLITTILAFSQTLQFSTANVKALKFFEKATKLDRTKNYDEALIYLKKAIAEDSAFVEAYEMSADIYHLKDDFHNEIVMYNNLLPLKNDSDAKLFLYLAEAQFNIGEYRQAEKNFKKALIVKGLTQRERSELKRMVFVVQNAIKCTENPVPFNPQNMGANINSKYDEYWPSLTADNSTLMMTREIPRKYPNAAGEIVGHEDIFVSKRNKNGNWDKAINLGPPINSPANEGAHTISFNGQFIFYTSCYKDDAIGRCDIYFSERIGDKWSEPRNIGKPINTKFWESQPCFSSDGRTLYFVSDRPGGYGNSDIWKSKLQDNGRWSEPENIGDSVNTKYDEASPFIHYDNKTLYFSSNGHSGLGQQDLFISRLNENGRWGKPQNLGYPINTFNDETGLFVSREGNNAFYASDRNEATGKDLYTFELPDDVRPVKVNIVKGVVVDSKSNIKLKADFELSDLETSEIIAKTSSITGAGEYLVCLPINKDYGLNVSKKGYLFHSENFSLKNTQDVSKPYEINISLQTIEVGKKEVLRNIFFETDSYELRKLSMYELNKLIKFLNENPEVKIEIGGHTDNVGTEKYNKELSEKRAKAVYDYLLQNDINSNRLSYKGYSYSQPYTTNETSKGRAKNRRTEFKIIEIMKQ